MLKFERSPSTNSVARTIISIVVFAICYFAVVQLVLAEGKPRTGFADGVAWVLTVSSEKYDRYLDFPNSNITSLEKFSVYYQPMDGSQPTGKAVHYKDFFYDKGKAIGSKQVSAVEFAPNSQGQIMVKNSPNLSDPNAIASVVVHLFLELSSNKAFPNPIIVDRAIFNDFVNGTSRLGFSRLPQPPPKGLHPRAVLQLRSEPYGMSQLLMY